jgi:hypothetical protein
MVKSSGIVASLVFGIVDSASELNAEDASFFSELAAGVQTGTDVFPVSLGEIFRISAIDGIVVFATGEEVAGFGAAVVVYSRIGSKNDSGERVGVPFQTKIHIEILAFVVGGIVFVFERVAAAQQVLGMGFRYDIVVGRTVARISAEFEFFGIG